MPAHFVEEVDVRLRNERHVSQPPSVSEGQHNLPLPHIGLPLFITLMIPPQTPKTLSDVLPSHYSQLLVLLQLSDDVQRL